METMGERQLFYKYLLGKNCCAKVQHFVIDVNTFVGYIDFIFKNWSHYFITNLWYKTGIKFIFIKLISKF